MDFLPQTGTQCALGTGPGSGASQKHLAGETVDPVHTLSSQVLSAICELWGKTLAPWEEGTSEPGHLHWYGADWWPSRSSGGSWSPACHVEPVPAVRCFLGASRWGPAPVTVTELGVDSPCPSAYRVPPSCGCRPFLPLKPPWPPLWVCGPASWFCHCDVERVIVSSRRGHRVCT